jgi:thiol-disulfide isomerase/thioredoxin
MLLRRYVWTIALLLASAAFFAGTSAVRAQGEAAVRVVYFTSAECPHCRAVFDEVLTPLQEEYGDRLQIKVVDISDPNAPGSINAAHYEMLVHAEEMFDVPPEERGLPMVIVGGEALVGEDVIRERLPCLLGDCLEQGGAPWPDIPGLADIASGPVIVGPGIGFNPGGEGIQACEAEEAAVCEAPAPIWVAYFYEVGCRECSRAEYDIRYVESQYPQLMIEQYNVQDDAAPGRVVGGAPGCAGSAAAGDSGPLRRR